MSHANLAARLLALPEAPAILACASRLAPGPLLCDPLEVEHVVDVLRRRGPLSAAELAMALRHRPELRWALTTGVRWGHLVRDAAGRYCLPEASCVVGGT